MIPGWPGRRGGMTVVRLVPRELLLLDWAGAGLRFTWAFALRAEGADATRLVARARVALPRRLGPLALAGRAILPATTCCSAASCSRSGRGRPDREF